MRVNAFRNAATLVFSVTFAGVMMAQSPSQPPQTPPTTQPAPAQERQDNLKNLIGQTVTVTGCLAQEGAAGQTTTAGTASDFVLTNVQVRSGAATPGASPGAPEATPSPTPGMAGAAGAMKIKLKETGDAELKENLNKRIEVTGRLEAGSSMPSTPGTPATPETGAPRPAGAAADMPQMQVSSVRVLEQTCTPGK